jgi:hypothetical protein
MTLAEIKTRLERELEELRHQHAIGPKSSRASVNLFFSEFYPREIDFYESLLGYLPSE